MYRLLACWNFGEMNVSLISMKNMIFLLGNPPSKCPKCQKFSRLRRAQGVAYYFENPRIWNLNVSLISFPKIGPNVNVSLIEGGAFIVNCVVVRIGGPKMWNHTLIPPSFYNDFIHCSIFMYNEKNGKKKTSKSNWRSFFKILYYYYIS